jgi:hypothetical protein
MTKSTTKHAPAVVDSQRDGAAAGYSTEAHVQAAMQLNLLYRIRDLVNSPAFTALEEYLRQKARHQTNNTG